MTTWWVNENFSFNHCHYFQDYFHESQDDFQMTNFLLSKEEWIIFTRLSHENVYQNIDIYK